MKKFILLFVCAPIALFSVNVTADASFYMTTASGSINATVQSPSQLVLGSKYEVGIPFPAALNMYATHWYRLNVVMEGGSW